MYLRSSQAGCYICFASVLYMVSVALISILHLFGSDIFVHLSTLKRVHKAYRLEVKWDVSQINASLSTREVIIVLICKWRIWGKSREDSLCTVCVYLDESTCQRVSHWLIRQVFTLGLNNTGPWPVFFIEFSFQHIIHVICTHPCAKMPTIWGGGTTPCMS